MTTTTKAVLHTFAAGAALAAGLMAGTAVAEDKVLKIGVLGVMSGPSASWGLVNKYSAETTAQMYNEKGGAKIGNDTYKIQLVSIDEKADPKLAISGAERLTRQEGIKYIIGPNVDTSAASIKPVMEATGAINFPYAFSKELYVPPASNSILGMVASYQAAPIIYRYMMKIKGAKSVSFVTRNEADPLNQRTEDLKAAKEVGLQIVSSGDTYEPGTTDFFPVMSKVVKSKADLIVLVGVAPADAPLLIKSARELGYKGQISTETAQDAKVLREVAGNRADGFVSVGGASTPQIRSAYMEEFIKRYTKIAGEWNDEAGTKAYALEMIIATLQKNPKAINDVGEFKKAIPNFSMTNPFLKDRTTLKYVGKKYFDQQRQIGVPVVVTEYRKGGFQTLFVGEVAD